MYKITFALMLFIFIASCQQNKDQYESQEFASVESSGYSSDQKLQKTSTAIASNGESQNLVQKKIIKEGRIGIKVKELHMKKVIVDSLLTKHNAYYANESFNNSDWESSFILRIRIPCTHYETFISEIESGEGEILYKQIDARDVTDQFIDLETRLNNKKNYLKRYNELLQKAKTVTEILEIEEKIRVLEEEIESTIGVLKYLSDQVDYSTLELTISQTKDFKYNPDSRDNFFERFKQSLSKGWVAFIDFVLLMLKFWPFWLIVVLAIYIFKKYLKPKK